MGGRTRGGYSVLSCLFLMSQNLYILKTFLSRTDCIEQLICLILLYFALLDDFIPNNWKRLKIR